MAGTAQRTTEVDKRVRKREPSWGALKQRRGLA
jgi:hypothetical protein